MALFICRQGGGAELASVPTAGPHSKSSRTCIENGKAINAFPSLMECVSLTHLIKYIDFKSSS